MRNRVHAFRERDNERERERERERITEREEKSVFDTHWLSEMVSNIGFAPQIYNNNMVLQNILKCSFGNKATLHVLRLSNH